MMIFSLVAMTGLEKSAYLQWLCHSGERPVARGPLVCIVTKLLLGFFSQNHETVTGNSPMDEDWRNTFGFLMCMKICNGAGAMVRQ